VKALASDLTRKTQELVEAAPSQSARERVQGFAVALFPALLKSAATTVVGNPREFLGLDQQGQIDLVAGVGNAILEAAESPGGGFGALFTQETLEATAKAALVAAARHPDLLGAKGERSGKLVAAIAQSLAAQANVIGPGLLPELVRLVLEKSAEQLDTLLPDAGRPQDHLLIAALKAVLPALSRPAAPGAKWKPKLGAADALALAEALLDEVVRNPQWLAVRANEASPLLGEVAGAVLQALREEAGARLKRGTAIALVAVAVQAVGKRLELGIADAAGKRVAAVVMAAIVKTVHGDGAAPAAAWLFARDEALERLTGLVFDKLAQAGKRADLPRIVQAFLDEVVERIVDGMPWTWQDLADLLFTELEK